MQQNLTVTLVLDYCHSGGATRSDAEIRGRDVTDNKLLLPTHQPVASREELSATWRSLSITRGLKASGIAESEGCVVLAACRPHEYAYEYAFNRETKERNDALTYWLLYTLKQQPGQTYKDLYDRLNAQIHSQFPAQTPLLLEEGDRLIFGKERSSVVFAVPVLKVEPDTITGEMRVLLGVGQANGVTKGAEFAIYLRGTLSMRLVRKVSLFAQDCATPTELQQFPLPPNKQRNSITRSSNPLEALLSAIGAEQPPTRSLKVAASPSREWTTKQVSLTINVTNADTTNVIEKPAIPQRLDPPETDQTLQKKASQVQPESRADKPQNMFNISGSNVGYITGSGNIYHQLPTQRQSFERAEDSPLTKTILMLAANPKGTLPLRLGEEARSLQTGLERSRYRLLPYCFR